MKEARIEETDLHKIKDLLILAFEIASEEQNGEKKELSKSSKNSYK